MKNQSVLLCIVLVPTIGAFILPLLSKISARMRNFVALLFVLTSFVLTISILPAVYKEGAITSQGLFGGLYNLTFYADKLAVFMALVSGLVSAIIVFYSFGYISHYENQNEYYLMVVLFFGAMMGLVFFGQPYIFICFLGNYCHNELAADRFLP